MIGPTTGKWRACALTEVGSFGSSEIEPSFPYLRKLAQRARVRMRSTKDQGMTASGDRRLDMSFASPREATLFVRAAEKHYGYGSVEFSQGKVRGSERNVTVVWAPEFFEESLTEGGSSTAMRVLSLAARQGPVSVSFIPGGDAEARRLQKLGLVTYDLGSDGYVATRQGRDVAANRDYSALTERDSDLRDLERRASAGDPEAVKKHRIAMNRSGKAPSGEVFFKDQAKKAAKELRQAAKYLRAAAKDLDGEAWNGADYTRDKFRVQAKAAGSAASRIDRTKKLPQRSHSPRSTALRTSAKPRTSDWRDQALAASDTVQTATSIMRDIAFTYEQEDRSAAERIFEPVRWLVYLGNSISGTRDPHGGHYQNDKWKRPIPM